MVVDTSALAAIVFGEPERELFEDLILGSPSAATSTAVVLETDIVLRRRLPTCEPDMLDRLVEILGIEVVPFDVVQAKFARAALAAYGQGRHEAGLTFGDCIVMGLARQRDATLLFKGDGFALTDIRPAWLPEGQDAA
jgi:ribonuclease VapC